MLNGDCFWSHHRISSLATWFANCIIGIELLSLVCVISCITLKKFNKSNESNESIKDCKFFYHILLHKYIDLKLVNETSKWQTIATEDKKSPKLDPSHLNVLTQLSLTNSNQKRFSSKINESYIRSKLQIAQQTQEIFYLFNDMILICIKELKYKGIYSLNTNDNFIEIDINKNLIIFKKDTNDPKRVKLFMHRSEYIDTGN